MKKLLFLLLFILVSGEAMAQNSPKIGEWRKFNRKTGKHD